MHITRPAPTLVALAFASFCLPAPLSAAPFTPGNFVVATAPTGTANSVQITIAEYGPAFGPPIQSFAIPAAAPIPFGGTTGNSDNEMQIAFRADNAQWLYVATTFTNVSGAAKAAGYLRVNAAGASIIADEAITNGRGSTNCRGVASTGSWVFTGSGSAVVRQIGTTREDLVLGNARWLEIVDNDLYVSTAVVSGGAFSGGPGLFKTSTSASAPATPALVFQTAANSQPVGFAVASADTIYLVQNGDAATDGLYKWTFAAGAWTSQGRLAAIASPIYDVEAVVSGATATLYVVTSTSIWKAIDPLGSAGAAWTGLAAGEVLTGLSRGRSIARVPGTAAPICGTCPGDLDNNGLVNGADIRGFVACLLGSGSNCACADFDADGSVSAADIGPFILKLRTAATCP